MEDFKNCYWWKHRRIDEPGCKVLSELQCVNNGTGRCTFYETEEDYLKRTGRDVKDANATVYKSKRDIRNEKRARRNS